MADKAKIERNLDLSVYINTLTRQSVQIAAAKVKDEARKNVRVDTGNLRNNIRLESIKGTNIINVITDLPYSLVQEFGHPRYTNYGFTPYMRPAVETINNKIDDILKQAEQSALRKASK